MCKKKLLFLFSRCLACGSIHQGLDPKRFSDESRGKREIFRDLAALFADSRIGGFHAISGDSNNNGEMNKCWWTNRGLISDLLFTVHQHGGDDVTQKPP